MGKTPFVISEQNRCFPIPAHVTRSEAPASTPCNDKPGESDFASQGHPSHLERLLRTVSQAVSLQVILIPWPSPHQNP